MKSSFSGRSHAQTITGGRSAKGFGGLNLVGRKARIEIGTSTKTGNNQNLFFTKNRMSNLPAVYHHHLRFDILATK